MSGMLPDTLPEGWVMTSLGEAFQINPPRPDLTRLKDSDAVTFVPMGAVDDLAGTINEPQIRQLHQVLSGFTVFREGDVIMAKITPCMENGKAAIASGLLHGIGFGSTEFHVLRPMDRITANYLLYFIRQPAFRKAAETKMTGTGGLKRVPAQYLKEHPFPLPPLAEQKRIVANLDAATQEAKATHAIVEDGFAQIRRFRQNALVEATSEGPETELGELLLDVRYGTSMRCGSGPTGIPVLRIPNVVEGKINLNDLKYGALAEAELSRLQLVPGDLLMIRSNGSSSLVGKTALVGDDAAGMAFAGYLMRIRTNPSKLSPAFLHLAMRSESVREQIEAPLRSVSGVNNINITELKALRMSVPMIERQQELVHRYEMMMRQADALETPFLKTKAEADEAVAKASEKAFRGELVPTEASLARAGGRELEDAVALLARIRAEAEEKKNAPRPKKTLRAKPMKLTPDSLKKTINAMPAGNFTFTELQNEVPRAYDELQKALFMLLEEKQPVIRQVFNKSRKRMELQRVPS